MTGAGTGATLDAAGLRAAARERLHPAAWDYLEGGSGDGLTLAANRSAFDAIRIMPRVLAPVAGGHTRLHLAGAALAHPCLLAPIAYQRLFHPEGECASAMAAAAQGGLMAVSSLASQPLEAIARAAGGPQWFQLYWQGDRERTRRLLRRAEAAGYGAVLLTVDAPVKHAVLDLPAGVAAVNLEPAPAPSLVPGASAVFDAWMAAAPGWDDLAWLRGETRLPLLVKGILHPDDAERAVRLGCDGMVVSNHGGRVLDGAPPAVAALPPVVDRVAGRVPVLLDSGIRNGRDVFKALSLGAAAVLVGRPAIWGLAAGGALGVARVLRVLRDELEMTMALAGCARLADIGRHCLA